LQTVEQGSISIGNNNTFTPNCFFYTSGKIIIGSHNLFSDGGMTTRVNVDEVLTFRNNGRYINGPAFTGNNSLGDGSQVIGPIRVQSCVLDSGGDFTHTEPDERGAVLKGYGLARGLHLQRGQVIDGHGTFEMKNAKMQSFFHLRQVP
jgi:hypothetical protein